MGFRDKFIDQLGESYRPREVNTPGPGETNDVLKKRLLNNVDRLKGQTEQTSRALGVSGPKNLPTNVVPRAIRSGGQVLAQAELKALDRTINDVINQTVETAGIVDESQRALLKRELNGRFNQLRMHALKAGIDLERQIQGANLKQEEAEAILGSIGGIAQGIGRGIALKSSLGGPSKPTGLDAEFGVKEA